MDEGFFHVTFITQVTSYRRLEVTELCSLKHGNHLRFRKKIPNERKNKQALEALSSKTCILSFYLLLFIYF